MCCKVKTFPFTETLSLILDLLQEVLKIKRETLKKNKKSVTNVILALTPPPKCDKKPSDFFGQKWPFQEVKNFDFNHAIICQSPQPHLSHFFCFFLRLP